MNLRKTKIICTMGPAVKNLETIKNLINAGMNIARFNFSHGDHTYHKEMVDIVKQARKETGIPVALLLDTKGPEIRTGQVKDGKTITLVKGNKIILTTDDVECTSDILSISYKKLPDEIKSGNHVFIADGLVDLLVEKAVGNKIYCEILNGAEIGSKKNVNVTGVKTSLPAITEKDVADIVFGIEQGFDFIAASFIRKPQDVREIQDLLDHYESKMHIISKIEDEEGVENIDEIIRVSSAGIMVARGDLGVQLKTEEIPLVQKRIIEKCNKENKPVITATQMLDSMINNPKPTRAEATDVANAIFDGTDAIMLSGETASGKYPVIAVQTMNNIACAVENSKEYVEKCKSYFKFGESSNMSETMSKAAFAIAGEIKASAIITPTTQGTTPKLISKYRPVQKIIAVTTSEEVQRKLLIFWGIYPILTDLVSDSDMMINNALKSAIDNNYVGNFDKVVIVAGVPISSPIMLNMIKVHQICNILGKGSRGFGNITSGKIVKCQDISEAVLNIKGDGTEILLTKYIDANFKPLLKGLAGIILEEFSSLHWDDIKKENP
ncbi:MAG TPA: pyruvate kinase, partial [Spirochaetota bacterium]|nr:pyruvate kinase [Spirochaetota bacterium]